MEVARVAAAAAAAILHTDSSSKEFMRLGAVTVAIAGHPQIGAAMLQTADGMAPSKRSACQQQDDKHMLYIVSPFSPGPFLSLL